MKINTLTIVTVLLTAQGAVRAQAQAPAAQAKPPVASVESRWSDVYCDLTELSRPNPSDLSVRFQYRNLRKTAFVLPNVELIRNTRVFDPASLTLFGVLKDADGKAIASTMLDGALARPVAAARAQAHYARLEPPPASVKAVTVFMDGCLPFENVAIGGTPAATLLSKPSPAIVTQEGESEGLVLEVTRLAHGTGGLLDLIVRYTNKGTAIFRFPDKASAASKRFTSSYVLDPASRRKFEVARDKNGQPVSSEGFEYGSGSLGEQMRPGESLTLWAKLAAPPDSAKTVTVYAALAPPIDNVAISGAAAGSAAGGSAIAGAVVGLDAALKDLGARVTESEIRIDLAADVLFDFDKADIKSEAAASLQNVATVLKSTPGATVTIEGHTDGRGADDYNQKLSEARAAGVKQWLVANAQVNGSAITTRGWGKSKPVAPNARPDGSDDSAGRAKNRRVEIVVRKGA